jgi:hypothetical protein
VSPAAFYCVSSAEYFLGAIALVNSLRLHGHAEPVYLLDCGLEPEQRQLAQGAIEVLDAPDDTPPYLLKTIAPLAHPAEVMVLIDVDMIATRSLAPLLAEAAAGRVVAFENMGDRFVPKWGELLDLGPVRPRRYVSSSFVAMGRDPGDQILRLLDDRQRRHDFARNCFTVNFLREPLGDSPLLYVDQDVLNAILASRIDPARVTAHDQRLVALTPFEDLELVDEHAVRCAYADGTEPYLLHHVFPGKPWAQPMPESLYSALLRRLLDAPDVAIPVPERLLPMRMRRGRVAELARRREQAALRAKLAVGPWVGRARALASRGGSSG